MGIFTKAQREKVLSLQETAANDGRNASLYEASAQRYESEGRRDLAKQARRDAAGHRRSQLRAEGEMAKLKAKRGQ